jgi:hypothetical protein
MTGLEVRVMRRSTNAIVLVLTLMAAPAAAQTTGKNELTVLGGASLGDIRSGDRDGIELLRLRGRERAELSLLPVIRTSTFLGGRPELGVRYGRHVSDVVAIEADFAIAPSHTLEQRISFECPRDLLCIAGAQTSIVAPDRFVSERIVAYHYGAGLRFKKTVGTLTPSIVAGLGGVTYAGDQNRDSRLAVRLGAGVTAPVGALVSTIEVMDLIVADHILSRRTEHDLRVRLGVGIRW